MPFLEAIFFVLVCRIEVYHRSYPRSFRNQGSMKHIRNECFVFHKMFVFFLIRMITKSNSNDHKM